MARSWFITGGAAGFGREWAQAALERGERVAVAARGGAARVGDLVERHGDRVLPLDLDVRDRAAARAAVAEAVERFGGLDVVVNNAGSGHLGMVEELTEEEVRAQLDVNLLGALFVTQAALPVLRAQGHGHLLQVSSEGGVIAYPGIGAYHASKWALEGLTESLAQEVAPFGVRVTLIEPGPYGTGWLEATSRSAPIAAYDALREQVAFPDVGDPAATSAAVLAIVESDDPPRRLLLGRDQVAAVTRTYEERIEAWRSWEPVSVAAFG